MNEKRHSGIRKALVVFGIVLFDLLLCAAGLLTFAWFHHAKPKKFTPVALYTPAPSFTAEPTPVPTPTPVPATADPDESEAAPTEEPTPTPTPEPTGLLGAKYASKFTDGEVIFTDECYRSANVCVEISRESTLVNGFDTTYFLADIYVRSIDSFRTFVSDAPGNQEWLADMADRKGAILATSGDFFVFKSTGLIIRNGMLYREKPSSYQDVCVLYCDGAMETYYPEEVDLDAIYARMPLHAWSFGPKLMENGLPRSEGFNATNTVIDYNPRCAFGYYEPGHYCLVVVDGRQQGYSHGLTMSQLADLMYDLGCRDAYNMDGGATAMMYYGGGLISKPSGGGGRQNCDMIYICEPDAP